MTLNTIDGKPIRWTDATGIVHACEGAIPHQGMPPLLWTLCHRDVPANTAWLLEPGDYDPEHEMCDACLAKLNPAEVNR